jgi:6-phosphogluconolactonase (cycloisomerase 2 family)
LTQLACLRDFVKEGRCGDATALEGANAIAISPDGHNLYVTAGGGNANAVAIFSRAGDGSLTQTGCISSNGSDGACATGAGLVGPADVEVSPDGKFVYVVAGGGRGELPASILTFARDPETGSLSQAGCMFANPPEGPCKDTSPVAPGGALALSPDGRNAYMAGSVGDQSALAVFDRDQSTGKLTQTSCMQEKASPSGDNNGQAAAVQCSEADNLNPSDVIVSRDGKFVYVAESAYSMIAVFARDSATGAVSGDECIQEPNPDIDIAAIPGCQHAIGITDPWSLALSPDGSTLYSAGNGVVAVFATAPASASRAAAVRGGAASIVVSCPGPGGRTCRGNVALVGAHAAKRFSLGAGSMRRIGVRVPGRVQRALRSRRRLPTRVVVRVADGRTRPVVHTVELRLGRPGR